MSHDSNMRYNCGLSVNTRVEANVEQKKNVTSEIFTVFHENELNNLLNGPFISQIL